MSNGCTGAVRQGLKLVFSGEREGRERRISLVYSQFSTFLVTLGEAYIGNRFGMC